MSWISDWWDELWEGAREGLGDLIANMYHIRINIFNIDFDSENIVGTVKSLTDWNTVQNFGLGNGVTLYSIGETISGIIRPVALTILAICFMISIINQCKEMDRVTWDRCGWWGLQFFILKFFVDNSYNICAGIMGEVNKIYSSIANGLNIDASFTLDEGFRQAFSEMGGFLHLLLPCLLYLVLLFPYIGTIVQIWAQLILRVVKILFCMAFSPVPIALAIEEETYRGKAIQYLMYVGGVAVEGILILIGSYIYAIGMGSISGVGGDNLGIVSHIVGILIMNSLFIAIIQLAHEFTDRMFAR